MGSNPTATTSPRWSEPERSEDGTYWRARLTVPRLSAAEQAAGLEPAVYGPTEDACQRETVRQDQIWADMPLRTGDHAEAVRRVRYLSGDDSDEPVWLPAHGSDVQSGDMIAEGHTIYQVKRRKYTPVYDPRFRIVLPDGSEVTIYKNTAIRILDPDGTVRERLFGVDQAEEQ
ncbi:hypothetical protein [Actinoallomurus iriomotensis]|uniref:Uncharacterized protein n=1 Tax=Actinoallomurus iriomotensis TaxID=478107 RepID=A0A9W6S8Q7_9ACTN|nr:hypothetical protein [Actinoallomurus iriomotensis]GLY87762.1 hypothetical protein Airi02_056910 [Actinoallomurus iriomotensis]